MANNAPGGGRYVDPYSDGSNSYGPFAGASLGGFQSPNLDGSSGYGMGGYTSFGDMFDGGGPGQSGGPFQGGPLSGAANFVTGRS